MINNDANLVKFIKPTKHSKSKPTPLMLNNAKPQTKNNF